MAVRALWYYQNGGTARRERVGLGYGSQGPLVLPESRLRYYLSISH